MGAPIFLTCATGIFHTGVVLGLGSRTSITGIKTKAIEKSRLVGKQYSDVVRNTTPILA